jgi:hypothetical protein
MAKPWRCKLRLTAGSASAAPTASGITYAPATPRCAYASDRRSDSRPAASAAARCVMAQSCQCPRRSKKLARAHRGHPRPDRASTPGSRMNAT